MPIGKREEFPGEGTAEVYVGDASTTARLLLVEAIQDGPYATALASRGPGLHHIAIDVPDAERFCTRLAGTGWYLHPKSLKTMREGATVWLARPGTAMLIEVHQREAHLQPRLIDKLELPLVGREPAMVTALGAEQLSPSSDRSAWITAHGKRFAVTDLLR